ncbi:hypothetical protein DPMN_144170 [Dreissena polymorpha]|uniref:Uncharacterized protein n=1 Tax=Dreissena polymorpha TaxID=45954 RepID=A0A9D4GKJ8_DREPO|nr:hypothetical protein DPMN_144170 [Dreissena polymorpha]
MILINCAKAEANGIYFLASIFVVGEYIAFIHQSDGTMRGVLERLILRQVE